MLRHFRGSGAIRFWTHTAFGLERNQQSEDEDTKLTTALRCLKCRNYGVATGEVRFFKYDKDTGRSNETDSAPAPSAEGFRREPSRAPNDY